MTIETSSSIENLAAALGKFQAETHGVVRDATNPFLKNRYATLEAVIETARPALAKAGLAFLQAPKGRIQDSVALETMLMHGASGEWIRFDTIIPLTKSDPQGVGSAITYACRYALMAMLGLPPLDDDAEAAKPQQKQPQAIQASAQDLQWKPEERPTGTAEAVTGVLAQMLNKDIKDARLPSKEIYIENAIKRMSEMKSAPELLQWATDERKMVWPQYGIEGHDPDGQRIVKVYKDRMAVLESQAEAV